MRKTLTNETIAIPEFGAVEKSRLDLEHRAYEVYKLGLKGDTLKSICDALSFQAQFDSDNVISAFVDVANDEGWFTFIITKNTRPQSLALRYSANQWFCLEEKVKEGGRPAIKNTYHADDLSEDMRKQLFQALDLDIKLQSDSLVRINFKDRQAFLIAPNNIAKGSLPDVGQRIASIGCDTTSESDSLQASNLNAPATESVTSSQASVASEPSVASSQPSVASQSSVASSQSKEEIEPSDSAVSTTKTKSRNTKMSDSAIKYDTYSRSEVDGLLKKQAENITATITTKMNAQQKAAKEAMKNQEYAFNQALERLTEQLEQTTDKLQKTADGMSSANQESMESFKKSLSKELEEFKTHISKNVTPGLKLLDARLEQLAEARKAGQPESAKSNMVWSVLGVVVVLALVVNLAMSWYALQRIDILENSKTDLLNRNQARDEVPLPDLMKDQIDKEKQGAGGQATPAQGK